MGNVIVLLFGLLVAVAAVFVIEDRSREFWPTVFMKAVFFLLGVGIMALSAWRPNP